MFRSLLSYLRLCIAYIRINFHSVYEYRAAFWSQVIGMFVNDCFWVAFWVLFFGRFPVLNDWTIKEVITLWSLVTSGFGIAHALFGNAITLPTLILKGGLDSWMVYPRALLPHMLLGKTHVTAWGDAIFGIVTYLVMVHPDSPHLALFLFLVAVIAVAFVGFSVLSGSVGFFIGSAETLAEQWRYALITFSTYPPNLFDGVTKLVLYTVIPAAFIGYIPVEALRNFSAMDALACLAGASAILVSGVVLFHLGLRRYESGNLTEMRG